VNEAPKPVVQTQMPPPEKATVQPEQVPPPAVVQSQTPPPPAAVAPAAPTAPAVVETPQSVTTVITTAPPTEGAVPQKTEAEKLNALEQQNAAIMNLLQTEYAQKIADYETQNTKLRGKVDEISRKMNRIESNLNQITQLLQGEGKAEIIMPPSSTLRSNKVTYHVQAIIPGRAWLKSEAGDTVTVAEGDILRNVGKVIKIDPYDGIVEIDVGNKVITLSYGMSAD
jgi:intracellular multiplication protein IcmG